MITQKRHINLSNSLDRTMSQGYEYTIDIVVDSEDARSAIDSIDAIETELRRFKQTLQEEFERGLSQ